ncbi:amino acid adenylation domain-containing protein [Streptomyces sp. NPDC001816]|uniref:amino acid adenylation domain-containing protein n=1 Tax=Streptomyces sp. NPDC001816 TaxID=3364612 RepID=UPI0036C9FC6E
MVLRTHHRRDRVRGDEARDCHALRVRLARPADPEPLARRLAAFEGRARLWVEDVPSARDEPEAVRRRARELARPAAARFGLRVVLLGYTGGEADLLLVAHRAVFGRRSLNALARAVLGDGTAVPERGDADVRGTGIEEAEPAWGLGDPDFGEEWVEERIGPPGGGADEPAAWLAALTVLLARYEPRERPVVAALGARKDEEPVLVRAESDGITTLGEVTAWFRDRLTADPPATAHPVTAGIVFDLDRAEEGTEYIPFLAPPFPLTITLTRTPAGALDLRCHSRPRIVRPVIANQFVRHLVEVHRQVSEKPWLPAAAAKLLRGPEREQVLALGRPARELESTARRIDEVFAERAAAQPDAVALSDEAIQVTYRGLDQWADRLAHGLREAGVRDGDLVGVCLERSAELVAVLLAVLKAGAVYVPLDPAYPAERLAYTVTNSGLGVVVTTLPDFPVPDEKVRQVTPVHLAERGARGGDGPPPSTTGAAGPAYVIYTSGSTGRPKGVLVPHTNVVGLLDATREDFELSPADVWTFFHSVAFDFSVWEIWGCLLTGGHLVVVPYWVSRSPEQFRDLLLARQVTVLNQTPSGFAQLMEAERAHAAGLAVRLVIFGGEPLDTRSLLPWLDRYPESRCRLVNMFGITETTVHVTAETITRELALTASRSVGRPLPGWYLCVLDKHRAPVPPGVAGEIYVGGAGVALGYLRRPELTAERFLPDPFTGGRLYRTGDRGRLRPDGRLEHLGRIDNQIKLRGFRIELDEIRSVLAESPGVAAAVVVLRQEDPADAATGRLDAYVVLTEGSTTGLRDRAARMLPEYMLPATITALPSLPTTANGKVDLAALPAPDTAGAASAPEDARRWTGDELCDDLLDVWGQLFGVSVQPSDDFFRLGGNSLLAVRMAAVMRERGLPALHPRTLYLNPTVRGLADALRS